MNKSSRPILLLVQEETGSPVIDPEHAYPVLAENSMTIKPEGDQEELEEGKIAASPSRSIVVMPHYSIDFSVKYRPSQAFHENSYDRLLSACGLYAQDTICIESESNNIGDYQSGLNLTNNDGSSALEVIYASKPYVFLKPAIHDYSDGNTISQEKDGETISSTIKKVYNARTYHPVTDPDLHGACRLYFFKDNILHTLVGARGDFSIDFPVGKPVVMKFSFKGKFSTPEENNMPAPVKINDIPLLALGENPSIGINEMQCTNISFALANEVSIDPDYADIYGVGTVLITGRRPTGSFDPKVVSLNQYNPISDWVEGKVKPITHNVGRSSDVHKMNLYIPEAEHTSPASYSSRNNIMTYDVSYTATSMEDGEIYFSIIDMLERL